MNVHVAVSWLRSPPWAAQLSQAAPGGLRDVHLRADRSLSYDDVLMTAPNDASFPPGLDGVTAPPGGESVALQDAPAQILPETAPGDVIPDKVDEGAEIEVDVSEWTMDEAASSPRP